MPTIRWPCPPYLPSNSDRSMRTRSLSEVWPVLLLEAWPLNFRYTVAVRQNRAVSIRVATGPRANHGFLRRDLAEELPRHPTMDRDSVVGVGAAEYFAVLGQVSQQPAIGDSCFDVNVLKIVR